MKSKKVSVRLNVSEECLAVECNKSHHSSPEYRFVKKLFVPNSCEYLQLLVLPNELCVAFLPSTLDSCDIESLKFMVDVVNEEICGKRKKGAKLIKAGAVLAKVKDSCGVEFVLKTPVGGHILEMNNSLGNDVSPFHLNRYKEGYLAIIMPDTAVPSLSYPNYAVLHEHLVKKKQQICFSWMKGECKYGSECRFIHSLGSNREDSTEIEDRTKRAKNDTTE